MRNYLIICCVFGIVIGLLGSISTIIGPIDKIYKTIMNIAFWLVVFVTIAVTSMLRVDWDINKSQLLTGVIAEIGTLLLVNLIVSKLIIK